MNDEEKKKHLSRLASRGLGESAKNVPDPDEDPELQTLLRQWHSPRSSLELDRRVLTTYRNQVSSDGRWKRLIFRSIPIPLPLAAALILVLSFLGSRTQRSPEVVRLEVPGPVPQVVRVEVPVFRERIVTRVVYRRSPETENASKRLRNDTVPSTADPLSKGPRRSQIAVQLADFEPVEKIQLKILKGMDQ
jgi:hypothetical protein